MAARSAAWGLAGALVAAAGTAAARCGGSCATCLACAVPGAGLILAALWRPGGSGRPCAGGAAGAGDRPP